MAAVWEQCWQLAEAVHLGRRVAELDFRGASHALYRLSISLQTYSTAAVNPPDQQGTAAAGVV